MKVLHRVAKASGPVDQDVVCTIIGVLEPASLTSVVRANLHHRTRAAADITSSIPLHVRPASANEPQTPQ